MKTLGQFLDEAKATYCGRCGTRHVPPAKGGTCPALKEGSMPTADEPSEADKKTAQKVGDLLSKEKKGKWKSVSYQTADGRWATKDVKEEAEQDDLRVQKIMHKGQHVASIHTFKGRAGGWTSGAHNPDGSSASKKYGIGMMDTKKEIVKKIKQYHKENNQ